MLVKPSSLLNHLIVHTNSKNTTFHEKKSWIWKTNTNCDRITYLFIAVINVHPII